MKLAVKDIKPNPDNPRIIKDDKFKKLVRSLKDFPEMLEARPIILNKDHMILGGNMRLKAAIEAGYKEVDAEIFDWPLDKQREFIIKDNISGGEWDWDLLANEWDQELLDDWGLDVPVGFGNEEVEEDEAPEVSPDPPQSVLGAVYQLGRHRLMCGDSTDFGQVSDLMNGRQADMVFTDPPYSVNYTKKNKEILGSKDYTEIKNDNLSVEDTAKQIWKPVFDNLAEIAKDDCSIYCTMPQGGDQMMMMMMMDRWQVKHELIWVKESPVFSMNRLDYDYKHEPIAYGWIKKHNWYGKGEHTKSVWEIHRDSDKSHPTMKPIALIANALLNSTKTDNLVVDVFGGSGSTLIACEQLDRTCFIMELDPKYCDVIRKRYAKFVNNNELPDNWAELTPEINERATKNG